MPPKKQTSPTVVQSSSHQFPPPPQLPPSTQQSSEPQPLFAAPSGADATLLSPTFNVFTPPKNTSKRAVERSSALAMKIKSSVAASQGRSPAVGLLTVTRKGEIHEPSPTLLDGHDGQEVLVNGAKNARKAPHTFSKKSTATSSTTTHLTKFIIPAEIMRFNSDSPEAVSGSVLSEGYYGLSPATSFQSLGANALSSGVLGGISWANGAGAFVSPSPTTSPSAVTRNNDLLARTQQQQQNVAQEQTQARATSPHTITMTNPLRICLSANVSLTTSEVDTLMASGISVLSERFIFEEQRRVEIEVRSFLRQILASNGVSVEAPAVEAEISAHHPGNTKKKAGRQPAAPTNEPPEALEALWNEIEAQYATLASVPPGATTIANTTSTKHNSGTQVDLPNPASRRKRNISAQQRQLLLNRLGMVMLPPRHSSSGAKGRDVTHGGSGDLEESTGRYGAAVRYFFGPVRYIVGEGELEPSHMMLSCLPFAISIVKRSWLSHILDKLGAARTTSSTATEGIGENPSTPTTSAAAALVSAVSAARNKKGSASSRWLPRHPNLSVDGFKDPRSSRTSVLATTYGCPSVTRPMQMHQPRQRQALLVPLRFYVHPLCFTATVKPPSSASSSSITNSIVDIRSVILASGGALVSDPLVGDANVLVFPQVPQGMPQYTWEHDPRKDEDAEETEGVDDEDDNMGQEVSLKTSTSTTRRSVAGKKRTRNSTAATAVPSLDLPPYNGHLPVAIRNTIQSALADISAMHPSTRLRRKGSAGAFRLWCLEQLDRHNAELKNGSATSQSSSPNRGAPSAPYSILNPTDEPKDSALMCKVLGMCTPDGVLGAVLKQSRSLPLSALRY